MLYILLDKSDDLLAGNFHHVCGRFCDVDFIFEVRVCGDFVGDDRIGG